MIVLAYRNARLADPFVRAGTEDMELQTLAFRPFGTVDIESIDPDTADKRSLIGINLVCL
ncbi:MAG: hypothetical protein MUO27_03950 [Sedimentisphaerales bacterium]|nr:hypothetical protein [Sedimentisphaerales bacterium]